VVGGAVVESSKGTWGPGVWIDRAGVEDVKTDGLAAGVCMRGEVVCDSVGTAVRPGSAVSVPTVSAAAGDGGPATVASVVGVSDVLVAVASAVAVGILVPSWSVGAGVRLAVGIAVSDGSSGGCVGPWVGGGLVNSRVGTCSVGSVVGGVTTDPVGVIVGMV
jgi:hypothetical protein